MGQDRPNTLSPGDRIGRCRIVRFLARGGMGEVYLAHDETLAREVAVKVLPPHSAADVVVERFMKEARLCSQITHPNVITIHDVGREKHLHYIVMQFVDGIDLQTMVHQQGGRLPYLAALRLIRPVAKGLHAAHQHRGGLIHRDIKPGNIMAGRDGQVYLMDFGLVREQAQTGITSSGQAMGTPAYMSPEQARFESLDRRSDIYSLGATLYYLLTGNKPANGRDYLEVMNHIGNGARLRTVAEHRPEIPREVSDFVQRAMAFRKADRFQTAQEMAQQLSHLLRMFQTDASDDSIAPIPSTTVQASPEWMLTTAEPDDLVPLTSIGPVPGSKLRTGLIAGTLLIVAVVAVSVVSILPDGQADVEPTTEPAPSITDGMVSIEAGTVQLGNDDKKVRQFLSTFISDPQLLDGKAKMVQLEAHRTVDVAAFWIDAYEVTQQQYSEFLKATDRELPEGWESREPQPEKADHPVVHVSYADAEAYAQWVGKRLPTREQWVRAFRGDKDWLFPWGDFYDATYANLGDNPKYPSTSPIHETPKDVSEFGVFNMVGNASEFIRGTTSHEGNTVRSIKGADWRNPGFTSGIGSNQALTSLDARLPFTGFRCVVEEE